jgi:acyl-CoA thioesterase FadM
MLEWRMRYLSMAHRPDRIRVGVRAVEKQKAAVLLEQRLLLETGGESGIRTPDLRIMIPSL